MSIRVRLQAAILALVLAPCSITLHAQHAANSNATYKLLRSLSTVAQPGASQDVIAVNNLELHRDAATFTFKQGSIAFYSAVNGKVTGAVFKGAGHLHITPPSEQERHNLFIQTKKEEFDEDFDQVVMRFTDATADELRKAATGKGQPDLAFDKASDELEDYARHHMHDNIDLRILQDVLSPAPGGYFLAAIHNEDDGQFFFTLDPQGVAGFAPEEVSLMRWNSRDGVFTYPLVFHRSAEYADGTASGNEHNAAYKILSENLDVSIDKSGFLTCLATVEVRAEQDGVAVIPFDLHSDRNATLTVSRVETDKSEPLDYVQENQHDDPDFGVMLAQPLKKGETTTIRVAYGGKNIILNEGMNNYYPIAREDWYPNSDQGFGDYANYRMLFHVPKGLQLIATGTKVSESTDGNITTSEWKSEQPLPVVGFSIGDFKSKEAKFAAPPAGAMTIDAYANVDPPDLMGEFANQVNIGQFKNGNEGTLNTTPMLPEILSQGETAAQIYTNYFGPLPFSHVSLTQQTDCNYGQSWPMLIYLPICSFIDGTQRYDLLSWQIKRADDLASFNMYYTIVTPHEVAHQWWGHTVGFRSYRDQWMSEGFANESATIFLQSTGHLDQFLDFWQQQRKLLTDKNAFGFRPIDVGPLTMGYRLVSPKAGYDIYRKLVYTKGAYILHMIRMMMWSPKDGDANFKAMMHDFVQTHTLQAATTEDFKAMVEKHMTPQMDLDGNHRMDWFFNQYVYGIDLPAYHFEGQVTPSGDTSSLHFKLIQSGVTDKFRMPVPLYLELANGNVIRIGSINITGNKTIEQTVQLPKLPAAVKKVSINHYYDVLCADN